MAKLNQTGEYNSFLLNNFSGVDFSSPLLSVTDNHAVDMKNFLKIDNVNQKRKGWIQRVQLPDKINGLWNFKATDEMEVYIAHAGNKIYEIKFDENENVYDYSEIFTDYLGIEDFRSSAVYSNHRLYIFCGNFIVIKYDNDSKKIIAKKVQDDDETTIPLTTMGITEKGSSLGGTRRALDDVNMMTKWRYNSLRSHTLPVDQYPNGDINEEKEDTSAINPIKFILDGKINIVSKLHESFIPELGKLPTNEDYDYFNVSIPQLEITYLDKNENEQKTISVFGTPMPNGYEFKYQNETIGVLKKDISTKYNFDTHEFQQSIEGNSVLWLYKDYINPLDGEDNILIKFDGSLNAGAEKVNKCRFCKVYGYGGNKDTLFASGNPDYPNLDFHSSNNAQSRYKSMQDRTFGDFTYWSDLGYNSYGSDENHVANYEVMGDGTLCVLKTESEKESTIYFRKGEFVDARSYDGVLIDAENNLKEIEYPCSVGAIGEAPFPYDKTMLNLNGDTLFLSKNGLFGLSYSSNITSSQRYSYARSRLVNKRLLTEELDKATACVFDNKYWLAFPNGHCYVFDGRYKFKLKDDLSSDFQYECFFLDNMPARGWMIKGNKLFFYTEKGAICEYQHAKEFYIDREFIPLEQGDYTIDFDTRRLSFNDSIVNKLKQEQNKKITFYGEDDLMEYRGSVCQNRQEIPNFKIVDINEGYMGFVELLLASDGNFTLDYPGKYYFMYGKNKTLYEMRNRSIIGLTYNEFIQDNGGDYVSYFYKECDRPYNVQINEDDEIILTDSYTGKEAYFGGYIQNKGYFEIEQPVSCYYYTKLYNFGTSIVAKTISSLTLTSDNSLYSECMFGYRTKYEINYDYQYNYQYGNIIGIDYENYDYTKIVYDPYNNFAQSFTYPSRIRNFNYIQFAFKNDDETNCALTSLSIVYSFGVRKRGLN